jgi:hypothetical protein
MNKKNRMYRLTIPALRGLRQSMEKRELGTWLVVQGEAVKADSVRIRFWLKKKPWVVTIEARRNDVRIKQ